MLADFIENFWDYDNSPYIKEKLRKNNGIQRKYVKGQKLAAFFTSYMMGRVESKLLKSQTGHKTDAMLSHYGSHRIEGDRNKIRKAHLDVFGGLVTLQT